ncbi:MAG: HNH endonuclease [Stenomitos frigidus ULC029]
MIGRSLEAHECVHHDDENPLNNAPDNLKVMTKAAHMKLHQDRRAKIREAEMTPEMVEKALQGRSLKQAARILGCHSHTLMRRFPEVLAPRKRKTPTCIDDPEIVELIRKLAPDPNYGYRDIALRYGIAQTTVARLCKRNDIQWVKKDRVIEKRCQKNAPYLRQPSIDDPETVALIRKLAPDPNYGLKEIYKEFGIGWQTVQKICKKYGIPIVKKSRRKTDVLPKYWSRTASLALLGICG